MREWIRKQGGVWTFGLFILALIGTVGGLAVWGLNAQDAKQNAKMEKLSAVATAAIRTVDEKAEVEVKRLDNRVDTTLELIKQINARLDRVDDRFDRVDVKLDRMDTRLNKMDTRLNKMEVRLDRMDGKLDTLLMRVSASSAN